MTLVRSISFSNTSIESQHFQQIKLIKKELSSSFLFESDCFQKMRFSPQMNSEVTYLKGEGRINFEGTCIMYLLLIQKLRG